MSRTILLTAAATLLASSAAHAANIVGYATTYGFNSSTSQFEQKLVSVDFTAGTVTPIGDTGAFLPGLAISPTENLYAVAGGVNTLYSVNTSSGALTSIGTIHRVTQNTARDVSSFDYRGGTLVGSDLSGDTTAIFSTNTSDASTSTLTSVQGNGSIRALTFKTDTTAIVYRQTGDNLYQLQSLDVASGAVTNIGSTSSNIVSGLDFGSDGMLYAVGLQNSTGGTICSVNPTTGAFSLIANVPYAFSELAIPVPEPTMSLLCAAVVPLMLRRRRSVA